MCIFILSIKGAMKVPNASQTLAPHATYMPEGCQTYVRIHISNLGQDLHKQTGLSKGSAIR